MHSVGIRTCALKTKSDHTATELFQKFLEHVIASNVKFCYFYRKSEHLTDELRKRLMEVSKQLKQMRSWTKNFVSRKQNGVYAYWMDTLDNIQGSCPSDTDQLKYDQMTAFFLEVPSFKSCFKSKKIYDTTGGVTINPSNQMVNFILQVKI